MRKFESAPDYSKKLFGMPTRPAIVDVKTRPAVKAWIAAVPPGDEVAGLHALRPINGLTRRRPPQPGSPGAAW